MLRNTGKYFPCKIQVALGKDSPFGVVGVTGDDAEAVLKDELKS